MKKLVIVLFVASLLVSCNCGKKNQTLKTYQDAEQEFVSTLSVVDTLAVLSATDAVMESLKVGDVSTALSNVYVVYNDVLYQLADRTIAELTDRFTNFPVLDYSFEKLSFSTPAINDVSYRYTFGRPTDGSAPATMKLVFNPVKIGGTWYLTLKDGNQSSKDLAENRQLHPLAPAPDTVVLNQRVVESK